MISGFQGSSEAVRGIRCSLDTGGLDISKKIQPKAPLACKNPVDGQVLPMGFRQQNVKTLRGNRSMLTKQTRGRTIPMKPKRILQLLVVAAIIGCSSCTDSGPSPNQLIQGTWMCQKSVYVFGENGQFLCKIGHPGNQTVLEGEYEFFQGKTLVLSIRDGRAIRKSITGFEFSNGYRQLVIEKTIRGTVILQRRS